MRNVWMIHNDDEAVGLLGFDHVNEGDVLFVDGEPKIVEHVCEDDGEEIHVYFKDDDEGYWANDVDGEGINIPAAPKPCVLK